MRTLPIHLRSILFYRDKQIKSAKNDTIPTSICGKGFGSGAELYPAGRPSYPQKISVWLQDRSPDG